MLLANHINYTGAEPTKNLSKGIWFDCPDELDAHVFFDDFNSFGPVTDTAAVNGWYAILDTSVTATQLATEVGGVGRLLTTATDNDFAQIITGGNTGNICKVDSGTKKKVWFEARVRLNQIVTQTAFVGLIEGGAAADALMPTAGTGIVSKDYIGFQVLEADTDAWQTGYNNGAADVGTVHNVAAGAIAASTWYKLGVKFDGKAVYFYIDGVQISPTTAGGAQDGIGILPDATDMPDGEELAVMLGVTSKGAAATSLDVDWVCCAMEK